MSCTARDAVPARRRPCPAVTTALNFMRVRMNSWVCTATNATRQNPQESSLPDWGNNNEP